MESRLKRFRSGLLALLHRALPEGTTIGKGNVSYAKPTIRKRPPTSTEWFLHRSCQGPHPLIGSRFSLSETDGMGVSIRRRKWGTIYDIDIGRCVRGLIYDGNASQGVRELLRDRGQDTWALVKYDDDSEVWEPVWEFNFPTMQRPEEYDKDFYAERQI